MRRCRLLVAFIALAVCVAVPASALLSCMADLNATAMEQMACCKGAKPDCPRSSQALECCTSTDHPQQQNFVKAPSAVNPLRAQAAAMIVPNGGHLVVQPTPLPVRPTIVLFAGTTSPPHLVFSALLI
jgi:hypothetical protein